MNEAPEVYCKKDKKNVPIWHCLGTFTQEKPMCTYFGTAVVHGCEWASVTCKYPEGLKKYAERPPS